MFIIIHRTSVVEAQKIFEYFAGLLSNEINSDIEINQRWRTIGVNGNRIDFRCGDMERMAGSRPDYYNTDSESVAFFLQLMADKVNGKEIKDISEIINIIGGTNGSSRSNKI